MKLTLQIRTIALFLIIFILPEILFAQASTIIGQISDARSKAPLEGVIITEIATGTQSITDTQGKFSLLSTDSVLTLSFRVIGYESRTLTFNTPSESNTLQITLQPAATNQLAEVVVTGFETNRSLLETAGALSIVDSEVIQRFDESSLVRAINTVPGVRMEERAPASYRISIRGSSLRAPYGVRNVKIYFNNVPLTESNGTTMLNLIDAGNIGRVEVLKGPTGSIYGAGTGGTLLLEPKVAAPGEHQLQVSATTGSFGFRRYHVTATTGGAKANAFIQYTRQQYDGFREQSAMERDVFLLSTEFYPTAQQTVSAYFIYSDLFYQLPGGLTESQYNENPRQARGGMFGSVAQNASMNMDGINLGLSHEYKFNNNWSNKTSVFGLLRTQDHPFNTDYERNANQEYGTRTRFTYDASLGWAEATFTAGGEYQHGFQIARTYDNNKGALGARRSDDELIAKTGLLFAQAEFKLPGNWITTAALSYNDTRYEITRLQQAASGEEFRFIRDFNAILLPRVALLKKLTDQISVHGSISSGYSPPTDEEILTSDGVLNEELEAEKGINYEAGIRGSVWNGLINFDVVGFTFRLNETIVSRQDVSSIAVFRNVGSTLQNGVETSLALNIVNDETRVLSFMQIWTSYTFNHFRFNEYQQGEKDLSGNKLTGVAPHTLVSGLDIRTSPGLYLNLTTNYSDIIPLNDENTVYAATYFVVGGRTGIKLSLGSHFGLDLFAGVDNATNKKYSLGNDLNAFGNRYFQPAPPRNYYGGLSLRYKL